MHISKLKQTLFWKDMFIHIYVCVHIARDSCICAYLIMIAYTYKSWTSAELATIISKCESPWILATSSANYWISPVRENEKSEEGGAG